MLRRIFAVLIGQLLKEVNREIAGTKRRWASDERLIHNAAKRVEVRTSVNSILVKTLLRSCKKRFEQYQWACRKSLTLTVSVEMSLVTMLILSGERLP